MGSSAKIIAAVVGCTVLIGCVGAPDGGGGTTVGEEVLQKVGLTYHWSLSLKLREGETIDEIHIVDDTLYCMSNMGRLFSVAAETGHRKWTYDLCSPGQKSYRPFHSKVRVGGKVSGIKSLLSVDLLSGIDPVDTTIINTQYHVVVLDRNKGKVLRKIKFAFAANAAGVADDRRFYVGSVEGRVRCLGLQEAIELSSFYTADVLRAPLVYYKEYVYAGGTDSTFYAAKAGNRVRKEWTRSVTGPITAEFHVDARACFVPCEDNRLYAFKTMDGSNFWDEPFICEGPLRRGVQVTDRTVLQRAYGDKFYAIDLVKGTQRWTLTEGLEVLGASGAMLYIRDVNNNLLVVDEILGDVKSSLPMTGIDLFARNVESSKIWAATRDGKLLCIRPR